ncbi:PAQR family membrane homeostasis protein TrhA [Nesterenkonia populi]|uniref:PAQR family membrane homeostasis protein TrhA n=1 Tax=Nesterenkonia populi TaxID=1591087 RepID=UPI0011BDCC97|nr:hemolysin III family protein [Nesterenkonia populi]
METTGRDSLTAEGRATAPAEQLLDPQVPLKPKLRGWLHAAMVPVALAAGIVAVLMAPSPGLRAAAVIYSITGLLLFSVSAAYHLGRWRPRTKVVLKRVDHANIMLLIAGTYTALTPALLPNPQATILLTGVWAGAIGGVLFRVFWTTAPRWLSTLIYVVLGLSALWFIADFFAAQVAAAALICVGGAAYVAGAVFYAIRRPNISPNWFGFHELFHACTLIGFGCHYAAILIGFAAWTG